ncbi:MAG: cytochrome c biogenesis protein CcdA [bacterium]
MDILLLLKQSMTTDASMAWILLLSFFSGVLISFTPCIYPMIPITIGIMQTQATRSLWRGLLTGLFYVLGLAMVYASLGFISATTSVMFGQWTSSPWFTLFIVLLFLYLAFSLFGFYEITIPNFFIRHTQPAIHEQSSTEQSSTEQSLPEQSSAARHPLLKSFLLGLFAGSVASPCLTPALAMLLTLVAERGNPLLGFFAMFLFAFGMGFLLIFIGMFSASLNVLPRAGEWMNEVKKFFGFVMLGVCVHMARNVLWLSATKPLYAIICASASIYYFYTGYYLEVGFGTKVKLFLGVCFSAIAIYLVLLII